MDWSKLAEMGATGTMAAVVLKSYEIISKLIDQKKEANSPKPPVNGKASKADLAALRVSVDLNARELKDQGEDLSSLTSQVGEIHEAFVGDLKGTPGYREEITQIKKDLKYLRNKARSREN